MATLQVSDVVGVWRLRSVDAQVGGVRVGKPWGDAPVGYLIYTATGFMSVDFMTSDHPSLVGAFSDDATPEASASALRTYHSYCGRFRLDGNDMCHEVEVSLVSEDAGTTKRRGVVVTGDTLTLVARKASEGSTKVSPEIVLTWDRCGTK